MTKTGLVVLLLLSPVLPDALALDVTACGQRVPNHQQAVLQADLSCPPAGFCMSVFGGPISDQACVDDFECGSQMACRHFAVLLERGARFALNGHSIMGTNPPVGLNPGVLCYDGSTHGTCTVTGPGTIAGFYEGVLVDGQKAKLSGVTLTGNAYGVEAFSKILQLTGVVASSNRYGIITNRLMAKGLDASGNAEFGIALASGGTRAVDVTANGCGDVGVLVLGPAKFEGLTANGNGGPGIAAAADLLLVSSTVTGNNGAGAGYDILATSPRLQGTTCGKSAILILDCSAPFECTYGAGGTLGLCSGD